MSHANIPDLDRLIYDGAIKLEITGGVPTWEVAPSSRHQRAIDVIRASIKPAHNSDKGCECAHLSDIYIRFLDGSLKRPDIAIFCTEPPDQDEALTVIPQAVVEVISPGYEYKDIALNPNFYLAQGVQDVVIVDPRSGVVTHYRTTQVSNLRAPVTLELLCGCVCVIPE